MRIVCFGCKPDLKPYVSSMLFDQHEIAKMTAESETGDKIEITLEVKGTIKVRLDDKVYTSAVDMPQEVKDIILMSPEQRKTLENYRTESTNWFEYVVNDLQNGFSDGVIFNGDLSTYETIDVCMDMEEIAREYFCEFIK